jgi:hypothetical protein
LEPDKAGSSFQAMSNQSCLLDGSGNSASRPWGGTCAGNAGQDWLAVGIGASPHQARQSD